MSGDTPIRDTLYGFGIVCEHPTAAERDEAIAAICAHLKIIVVRTNQTKHGNVEIQVQQEETP